MTNSNRIYFSRTGLKARGWTDRAIDLFLSEPDLEMENPHYKNAAPMKLYLIRRVEEIEKTEGFIDFKSKSLHRTTRAKKAVKTKRDRLIEQVKEWKIDLKRENLQTITNEAIVHYNKRKECIAFEKLHGCDFTPASSQSDRIFLRRIITNYLRHQLSNYEEQLERIFGKVGTREAYKIVRGKINKKIFEVYPELNKV